MSNSTGFYPRLQVDTTSSGAVGQAGGVLLTETIAAAGLGPALSGWRKPFAVHDPAKVVTGLAVTLALGGDCLADIALLPGEPGLYRAVASDATVSRTITALAADAPAVLAAIGTARAMACTPRRATSEGRSAARFAKTPKPLQLGKPPS